MSPLLLIGIAVASVVIIIIIVAALRPAAFRILRSVTIAAPAAAIFKHVNDLHRFQGWSPWAKLDPTMKGTFAGPSAGIGAIYSWAGNAKVGEGRMTITESLPGGLIRMKLEFLKPFQATNTAEFTFTSQGNQTVVEWSMTGVNNVMFRIVGLFMSLDKIIGRDFERGLANLRTLSETSR